MSHEIEKQLEGYLYQHIPISQAIGIRVEHASSQKIILYAPFKNNINHKKTVFGGSLHAVATLACWSLLHMNLKEAGEDGFDIVITKSEISYQAPVDADFRVECVEPESDQWLRFLKILKTREKARIQLSARIFHKDQLCVDYQATFAAIKIRGSV